jgi:hypothetical protein
MSEPFTRQPPAGPTSPKDPFGEGPKGANARRMRSIAMAVAMLAFVALIFAVSVLRMSGNGGH